MKKLISVMCLFACGCSQLMVSPKGDEYLIHSNYTPEEKVFSMQCTKSKAGPVLDTVGLSLSTIFTGIEIGAIGNKETKPPDGVIGALAFGALTVVYIASAVNGFNNAGDCKKLENYFHSKEKPTMTYVKPEPSIKIEVNNTIQIPEYKEPVLNSTGF